MISLVSNDGVISYGIKHFVADTSSDLATINTKSIPMGSTAFVIENSKYYMLNGEKVWKTVNLYGAGGSGSSAVLPDEIISDGGGA